MKRAALPALLLFAACKPVTSQNAATTPGPSSSDASSSQKAITMPGSRRLSADVSPLTGSITGFAVQTTEFGTTINLASDVLFDFDKASLRPDATAALTKAAELIRAGGSGSIEVLGYTDAKGDDDYNLELSRKRAQAVTAWVLGQSGMSSHVFEVRGKGEADPVAPNSRPDGSDDPVGRAKNRRVEIVIPKH